MTQKEQKIIDTVCEYLNISKSNLIDGNGSRPFVNARMWASYFMRKYTETTFKRIGIILGGRDHSSIIHYSKRIETELIYPAGKEMLKEIDELLNLKR